MQNGMHWLTIGFLIQQYCTLGLSHHSAILDFPFLQTDQECTELSQRMT
jgi:hypothetical protein